jgi:hopanoid biosynthesis associated protein HpnK
LAHRHGVLTAASLMVGGRAAREAVRIAQTLPSLRVGLHVVTVDGAPVLPPHLIPGLVDHTGRLRRDLARLGSELAASRTLRAQLRAEVTAQFDAYRQTGLPLDHVDVHKHFHLHPVVAGAIIEIGRAFGMRRLRVPAEPVRIIRQIEHGATPSHILLMPWIATLRRRARKAGLATPDAVFGLAWSGRMTRQRLASLLGRLPPGDIEVYTHPATRDDFTGYAPGYCYSEEFEALCDPTVIAAARAAGLLDGGYAGMSDRGRPGGLSSTG